MCVFTCFGYAALSSSLGIQGSTKLDVPYGLFITSVSTGSTSNVDKNAVESLPYSTTVKSTISRSRSTGTVTYNITVLNNTNLTYSYRGIYYQTNLEGYTGNNYVSTSNNRSKIGVVCSLASPTANKKVAPGDTLNFTVTYTIGSSMSASTDWKTMINLQFGINVDGEREALEIVESKFLNILNTQSTYLQLLDALDNKFDGRQEWTSNYIGNVTGSSSADSMAVNTLFAGQLQITVGEEDMDATVLIKHENLDGNTLTGDDYKLNYTQYGEVTHEGCEMTLYLTIDPLNRAGTYVPVYAVVFTCDRDEQGNRISDWYRIGSTYAGTANVVTYDGGNGTGSFVTDNWRSSASTYQVTENYSYRVDANVTIKTLMTAVDQAAITEFQNLLIDAEAVIANHKYAGTAITDVEDVYRKASAFYTVDASGKAIADQGTRRVWLIPIMQELDHVLTVAHKEIDKIEQGQGT
jgi:hypothetical protein